MGGYPAMVKVAERIPGYFESCNTFCNGSPYPYNKYIEEKTFNGAFRVQSKKCVPPTKNGTHFFQINILKSQQHLLTQAFERGRGRILFLWYSSRLMRVGSRSFLLPLVSIDHPRQSFL